MDGHPAMRHVRADSIPRLFMVEPSGKPTRRRLSGTYLRLRSGHCLQDLTDRLRGIRERSVSELESLATEFSKEVLRYHGTELVSVRDGAEAAEFIRGITRGSKNIVVNRSSSIINEVKPQLQGLGFRILEPYYSELGGFDNRIQDYWELPGLLAKGLMPGFETQDASSLLSSEAPHARALKDCVAVVGLSAACAQDGSLFFLQHSSNISKTIEHARDVVVVVGLDKIVKMSEDAAFQVECMGIFGMEAMLLNLRQRERTDGGIEDLPSCAEGSDRRLYVIVLDNGRRKLLSGTFRELLFCIGCKACVIQCPINRHMNKNGALWSPRDHLFMFLAGHHRLMDHCLQCEACRITCPLSIDLPKLMMIARAEHAVRRGRTLRDRILGNPQSIAKFGALIAPVSNAAVTLKPTKMVINAALGFDGRRTLPEFHHETFKRWFCKRKAAARSGIGDIRVAYFAGCFANYYQPDLAKAVVRIMEKNGCEVAVPTYGCCGMPMIANKNMAGFRRNAEDNIRSLAAFMADGWEVVTSCPSCALMIRRGYPSFRGGGEARLVAEHVYYLDEYLVRLRRKGSLAMDMTGVNQTVLCHVPCHLRVQDNGSSTLELLRIIPGLSIMATNATCCGMGGYHGYKKAYSDLSLEIGKKLFADVKKTGADRVVTGCAACKLQIAYYTGVTAVHPIQLMEEAYGFRQ